MCEDACRRWWNSVFIIQWQTLNSIFLFFSRAEREALKILSGISLFAECGFFLVRHMLSCGCRHCKIFCSRTDTDTQFMRMSCILVMILSCEISCERRFSISWLIFTFNSQFISTVRFFSSLWLLKYKLEITHSVKTICMRLKKYENDEIIF